MPIMQVQLTRIVLDSSFEQPGEWIWKRHQLHSPSCSRILFHTPRPQQETRHTRNNESRRGEKRRMLPTESRDRPTAMRPRHTMILIARQHSPLRRSSPSAPWPSLGGGGIPRQAESDPFRRTSQGSGPPVSADSEGQRYIFSLKISTPFCVSSASDPSGLREQQQAPDATPMTWRSTLPV